MPERKPYAPPPTADPTASIHDPYAAFRFRAFAFYTLGNFIAVTGRQMLTIAIEWEVYARTHSATALGLVGLVAAVPIVTLSLPAGHLADRVSRKSIILWTQAASALCSISLALISWKHLEIPRTPALLWANDFLRSIATVFERHPAFHFDDLSLPLLYLIMLLSASIRTFTWAARSSFLPTLVPMENFANAVTWNSSMFQISCVLGPALGGFLIVRLGFPFIYALDAVCALVFFFLVLPIEKIRVARRVVVFTCDTTERSWRRRFWLTRDYLSEVPASRVGLATELARAIEARMEPVLVPWDCADGFFEAYWRRPEAYLDENVRRGISVWAAVGPDAEQRAVRGLRQDLATGRWAERNRDLVDLDAAELGLRLLIA